MDLHCSVINLEHGGLMFDDPAPLVLDRGHYDFTRLKRLVRSAEPAPHLIGINEAKHWQLDRRAGLSYAADVLATTLGRPYVGLMGWLPQGFAYPALFYDPSTLTLDTWGDLDEPALNKRNLAAFHFRVQPTARFQVFIDHWPFWSGHARLERAKFVGGLGDWPIPTLFIGDLNGTASGPHLPQRDWYAPGIRHRHHKGKLVDGVWVTDTDALDHMIGLWDPAHGGRFGGEGWYAAEEAHDLDNPAVQAALVPTVNPKVDDGGGLLIDWALHNRAWRGGVVEGSVRVDIPPPGEPYASDHRRKTWTMTLD